MSDSLRSHGLQHTRLPCRSPSPRACSNSCPSSWWFHPTISSSVVPFSSCLQSFPSSGSFPMSQFFTSGGQSIGFSASTSVLPMNIQDWFPLGLSLLKCLPTICVSRSSKSFSFVLSLLYRCTVLLLRCYISPSSSHPLNYTPLGTFLCRSNAHINKLQFSLINLSSQQRT